MDIRELIQNWNLPKDSSIILHSKETSLLKRIKNHKDIVQKHIFLFYLQLGFELAMVHDK